MKHPKYRVLDIIRILRKEYPDPKVALRYKTALELLIATILSAQCTDERVNKITPLIFKKYKSVQDFAFARQSVFENEIRSAGFFRNKAKNIIAASKKILKDFNGNVPDNMEGLVSLPGVARKTANIVLSSYFKKAEGIAVDTHVKRLSQRLGLTKEHNPDKIEKDLIAIIPKKDWIDFNYLIVNHGRVICNARKPLCCKCKIAIYCPAKKLC